MDGQGGVVGLHNGVRHLGGGDNRVGVHDSVGVLLSEQKNIDYYMAEKVECDLKMAGKDRC